jgi:hypothetical protein
MNTSNMYKREATILAWQQFYEPHMKIYYLWELLSEALLHYCVCLLLCHGRLTNNFFGWLKWLKGLVATICVIPCTPFHLHLVIQLVISYNCMTFSCRQLQFLLNKEIQQSSAAQNVVLLIRRRDWINFPWHESSAIDALCRCVEQSTLSEFVSTSRVRSWQKWPRMTLLSWMRINSQFTSVNMYKRWIENNFPINILKT